MSPLQDYDPVSGRFLSRDPVQPILEEPESVDPYQFAYQNPLIYSDPTGEFTITQQNVTIKIDQVLRSIIRNYFSEFKQGAINKAQNVLTDLFTASLRTFTPQYVNQSFPLALPQAQAAIQGSRFEDFFLRIACYVLYLNYQPIVKYIWLDVNVKTDGTPLNDGRYQCGPLGSKIPTGLKLRRGQARPDFVIKDGAPTATPPRVPPAFLIGDVKRQVTTIKTTNKQWKAIMGFSQSVLLLNHANVLGQQYAPVALYVTLFGNSTREKYLKRLAASGPYFIALQIISFS